MTPTEQQNAALAAFVSCVVARLNPTLNAHTKPHSGEAEYEVLIGGRGMEGVLHEQIEEVLRIASDHGGRAFIDTSDAEWPVVFKGQGHGTAPGPAVHRLAGPPPKRS